MFLLLSVVADFTSVTGSHYLKKSLHSPALCIPAVHQLYLPEVCTLAVLQLYSSCTHQQSTSAALTRSMYSSCTYPQYVIQLYSSCIPVCTPAVFQLHSPALCTPAALTRSMYSSCTPNVLQLYSLAVCTSAVLQLVVAASVDNFLSI